MEELVLVECGAGRAAGCLCVLKALAQGRGVNRQRAYRTEVLGASGQDTQGIQGRLLLHYI